jgi:hypothetical protein
MSTQEPTVLATDAAEYVLPAPPRTTGEVVVVAPNRDQTDVWRRGSDVARALGERFLVLVENQQIFAAELRERLQELDLAAAEGSRAQWKGAVRDLLAVLDWSDAGHGDLLQEARWAASGSEPIDLAELCQAVAAKVQTPEQAIHVSGFAASPWWGSAPALAAAVRQGLELVAERTQGSGARLLEIEETSAAHTVRIASSGEPSDAVDAASVARFRRAAAAIGAVVTPDTFGPGGAGLVLELRKPVS